MELLGAKFVLYKDRRVRDSCSEWVRCNGAWGTATIHVPLQTVEECIRLRSYYLHMTAFNL